MNTLANKNGFRKTKFANSSSQTNERTYLRTYVRTKCITKTLKYIFEKCTFFSSFQEMMDLKGMKRQNACFYHDKIFFKCLFKERMKKKPPTRKRIQQECTFYVCFIFNKLSRTPSKRTLHFNKMCERDTKRDREREWDWMVSIQFLAPNECQP